MQQRNKTQLSRKCRFTRARVLATMHSYIAVRCLAVEHLQSSSSLSNERASTSPCHCAQLSIKSSHNTDLNCTLDNHFKRCKRRRGEKPNCQLFFVKRAIKIHIEPVQERRQLVSSFEPFKKFFYCASRNFSATSSRRSRALKL